jgi:hypothetical protein
VTIEQDIDYHLPKYRDADEQAKSTFAYCSIIARFEQVREHAVRGDDLTMFGTVNFIPPALRTLVLEYNRKEMEPADFLIRLQTMQDVADAYLKSHGCYAQRIKDQDAAFEEAAAARHASLERKLDDVERMIKDLAKEAGSKKHRRRRSTSI